MNYREGMKLMGNEIALRNGEKLVESLKNGTFVKNHRTNHAPDFDKGYEDLYRNRFVSYLGSCGCFLMDRRLETKGREYRG